MKKIKKSTRVKMVGKLHKLAVYVGMLAIYYCMLDFINRLNISSDQYYFATCSLFFIFDCFIGAMYWIIVGDEADKKIKHLYSMHRRAEYKVILDKKQAIENKKIEERNKIMNQRFDEWYAEELASRTRNNVTTSNKTEA